MDVDALDAAASLEGADSSLVLNQGPRMTSQFDAQARTTNEGIWPFLGMGQRTFRSNVPDSFVIRGNAILGELSGIGLAAAWRLANRIEARLTLSSAVPSLGYAFEMALLFGGDGPATACGATVDMRLLSEIKRRVDEPAVLAREAT